MMVVIIRTGLMGLVLLQSAMQINGELFHFDKLDKRYTTSSLTKSSSSAVFSLPSTTFSSFYCRNNSIIGSSSCYGNSAQPEVNNDMPSEELSWIVSVRGGVKRSGGSSTTRTTTNSIPAASSSVDEEDEESKKEERNDKNNILETVGKEEINSSTDDTSKDTDASAKEEKLKTTKRKRKKKDHRKSDDENQEMDRERFHSVKRESEPSPLEVALLRTAAGRFVLALVLILRELLKCYIPQLYFPVAVIFNFLARETSIFLYLGLMADEEYYSARGRLRGPGERSGRAQGGGPSSSSALLDDEDEEDEDEVLSAEVLMPAPVNRFRRVSAGFLARHGLVLNEEEEMEGGGRGRGLQGRRERRRGPSFTITFGGPKASSSAARGLLRAQQSVSLKMQEVAARRLGGTREGPSREELLLHERGSSSSRMRQQQQQRRRSSSFSLTSSSPFSSSSSWKLPGKDLLPDVDLGSLQESFTNSVSSLTKGIKKGLLGSSSSRQGGKKTTKKTPPRPRVLFDDDEDESEEGGGFRSESTKDPIGIPPRKAVLLEKKEDKTKTKTSSLSSSSFTTEKEKKKSFDDQAHGTRIEGKEEEDDDDWLSSLKRRSRDAAAAGARKSQASALSGFAQIRRKQGSRSLFHDDDDDEEDDVIVHQKKPTPPSTEPKNRDRFQRFVRRVDDVTTGRFPGVDESSAKARLEELRKRASMSYNLRRFGEKKKDEHLQNR